MFGQVFLRSTLIVLGLLSLSSLTPSSSGGSADSVAHTAEQRAKSLCEQAEALLQQGKAKEAQAAVAPLLKDIALRNSPVRFQVLYYHGLASYQLQDYFAAGKSLNQLTPLFSEEPLKAQSLKFPLTHARYLLARVHHQEGERVEAALHYEGVCAAYDKEKRAAVDALKRSDRFKKDDAARAYLVSLARGPAPEHVAKALFHIGVIYHEDARFGEAITRLTAFESMVRSIETAKTLAPLVAEAQLRRGICQVQIKQFDEAIKSLQSLRNDPRHADQALLWIGRAHAGKAEPNNSTPFSRAMKAAIDNLQQAAEKAKELAAADPSAARRRAEILLELADTLLLAKQPRQAIGTYAQLLADKSLPDREEELLERQATALFMTGDYGESDKVCLHFQQKYPQSLRLPSVLFRHAENSFFTALAADKLQEPDRSRAIARYSEQAIKRYHTLLENHADFPQANQARYNLARLYIRRGDHEKAKDLLDAIPANDRVGELALASYLQAECCLKLVPPQLDNALAAGQAQEYLTVAAEQLEAFIGIPGLPQTPEAILKLGQCYQRLAALQVRREDRNAYVVKAKAVYDRMFAQYPRHELFSYAKLERAKSKLLIDDRAAALSDLNQFRTGPMRSSPVAPLALVEIAKLLRAQKNPGEAVTLLDQCRKQHEATLLKDPKRAAWVPLIQLHHGQALHDSGKFAEARATFEGLISMFPTAAEAIEARFGAALAMQTLKQYDEAIQSFTEVTKSATSETAARAQFQIGLCLLEQKKRPEAVNALLVVTTTYEFPELKAAALCEAARAYMEMQKKDEAVELLQRVVREHGQSRWAKVAKERMGTLRKR